MKALFVTIVVAIILICNNYVSAQDLVVAEKRAASNAQTVKANEIEKYLSQSFERLIKSLLLHGAVTAERKKEIFGWKLEIKTTNNIGIGEFPKGVITADDKANYRITLSDNFEEWATGKKTGWLKKLFFGSNFVIDYY